jgi:molecular chaperone IbpA
VLLVSGQKAERKEGEYLHRGLPAASFEQRFSLAPTVRVMGASLENGLLVIDLKREVPEAMQPRRIEIQGARAGGTPADRGPSGRLSRSLTAKSIAAAMLGWRALVPAN